MIAIETDVLVAWAMDGAPGHRAARDLFESVLSEDRDSIALTPQVLFEFLHVVTDARRFELPLPMAGASALAHALWEAPETVRVLPGPMLLHRVLELLSTLRLGRKRILDTALAATLEEAGVARLATFNGKDFTAFGFLEIVEPTAQ